MNKSHIKAKIGVIGAGAWGSALAQIWAQAGQEVTLWTRHQETAEAIRSTRRVTGLPGIQIDTRIVVTSDFSDIQSCDLAVYALPAQVLRPFLKEHALAPAQALVIASKGIEVATGALLPDIAAAVCPDHVVAVLSGPNIAIEVAQGKPAASTLACADADVLSTLQATLSTRYFRLYPSPDVIGVSVGGAVKNVILMASGIVEGVGLGENARAAVLTRGLAEMVRLALALGGQRDTLIGLSGAGDLFLKTRNYRFGRALADGNPQDLPPDTTIEGVTTARAVVELAGRLDIEMPICVAVAAVLSNQLSIAQAVDILLQRPARRAENE